MKHRVQKWNEAKKENEVVEVDLTPIRAIRLFCVEVCMAGQAKEVKLCPDKHCPLFPYRMGTNPAIQLSDAEVERRRETAKIAMPPRREST